MLILWSIELVLKSKNRENKSNKLKIRSKTITNTIVSFSVIRNSLIILIFVFINIWFAVNRMVALYAWVKLLEFFLLGFYIVKTKPDVRRSILSLSIGIIYSSILAIAQFILQHSVGGVLWFLGERMFSSVTPGIAQIPLCLPGLTSCPLYLRSYATFPHPNVLGGFLVATLPLIIWQFFQSNNKKIRIFFGVIFVLGCVALLLTFSRSAWAVGFIAIFITIAKIKQITLIKNWNKKIIVLILIFIVVLCILVTQQLRLTESVVVRLQLAAAAIQIWKTVSLFGVGLGNFLVALPRYLPSRTIYFLQPVHNIYLLLLSEIGLVGIGIALFSIISLVKRKKSHTPLSLIIRNSLFTICILGFIDHYSLTLQQGQLLLTLFISLACT